MVYVLIYVEQLVSSQASSSQSFTVLTRNLQLGDDVDLSHLDMHLNGQKNDHKRRKTGFFSAMT